MLPPCASTTSRAMNSPIPRWCLPELERLPRRPRLNGSNRRGSTSAIAAVLERIGDEVRHRPLQPIRIPPAISVALEAEADLPIGQSRSKLLDDPRAQLVPVHGRRRQLHSPHVRELDQVPDGPVHALRARYDAGRDLDTFHRERCFLPERERPHQDGGKGIS